MELEPQSLTLPLLPVSSKVFTPDRILNFPLTPEPFYKSILEYAKKFSDNYLAVAYPANEGFSEGPLEGPLKSVATIIQIEYCEPVIQDGELFFYSIEARGLYKAKIAHMFNGFSCRMAVLSELEDM